MINANLLIIHQGALGDFILTFPAIIQLHKYYKPIDVLCQNQLGKLAGVLGLAINWFPIEAASFASLFSDQIDPRIKKFLEQYENIILFAQSEKLEQSINSITTNLRCRLSPKPTVHQRIHVTKFVLNKILNCGLISKADARLDDIPLPVRDDSQQSTLKILLHPGAGSTRKRWPVSNFLRIEAALKNGKFNPEFILGPAERNLADELQHPGRVLHVLDDLLELLDIINSAAGYIGNDSGASHLAAYTGLPTTVIFGPADPERWTPIGRTVNIIRPSLQCRPCFETELTNCDDPKCLADTSPQKVVETFYKAYSSKQN